MERYFLSVFCSLNVVLLLLNSVNSSSSRVVRSDHFFAREKCRKLRMQGLERELDRARVAIKRAAALTLEETHGEGLAVANVYRNPAAFFESYRQMEKQFKVYIYEEGEPPLVHRGPCKNIYTVEGRFIEELEKMRPRKGRGGLRTWDPHQAHVFFLPFSVTEMVRHIFQPPSYDLAPFRRLVADYIGVMASKHPFWNCTSGADHFILACHDWGPYVSNGSLELYTNSIRALCNANISEGFLPLKDVSIPEINLIDGDIPAQLLTPATLPRTFLAFFAGGLHGPIRPLLLEHWKDHDPDRFPVYEYLPANLDYYSFLLRSHFCLCPSGWEVASPRIVEAIYAECIPVIIAEGYVPPFSDVLKWEAFSVSVAVADIPRLRKVLEGIPEPEVKKLREGVRAVRMHFVLNQQPRRFDVFHMILHSVWLRRLNVRP